MLARLWCLLGLHATGLNGCCTVCRLPTLRPDPPRLACPWDGREETIPDCICKEHT